MFNKLKEELDKKEPQKDPNAVDEDFFTSQVDVEQDFEADMDNDFQEKKMPFILKLFIFLIVVAVISVAGYYIYKLYF